MKKYSLYITIKGYREAYMSGQWEADYSCRGFDSDEEALEELKDWMLSYDGAETCDIDGACYCDDDDDRFVGSFDGENL